MLVRCCSKGSRTPSLIEAASKPDASSQGSCASRVLQAANCPGSACADPCRHEGACVSGFLMWEASVVLLSAGQIGLTDVMLLVEGADSILAAGGGRH